MQWIEFRVSDSCDISRILNWDHEDFKYVGN